MTAVTREDRAALSDDALLAMRDRCREVAANDTSDNCGPDPHPGEQHQAPEAAADVASIADELITLRAAEASTQALREAAERLCTALERLGESDAWTEGVVAEARVALRSALSPSPAQGGAKP